MPQPLLAVLVGLAVLQIAIFSTTVLLNVSRKGREFRFEELVVVRHAPPDALAGAIRDRRSALRADERVLKTLHRRVFVNRILLDGFEILISCYVEAVNKDQFLAVKEDLFMVLLEVLRARGIRLASATRLLLHDDGGSAAAGDALGGGRPTMGL